MIKSLLNSTNTQQSLESLFEWIRRRNQEVEVNVEQIPFVEMKGWKADADGNIRHESGKFFSIEGIHVSTDVGDIPEWKQPIINQPEIGYLGILTRK